MISWVGRRLSVANILAVAALVFAMSGGAYAAKHYLLSSTSQISPKVLKALRGKAGPAGAAGLMGPAGPAGGIGPAGAAGKDGTNGTNGANGKDGKDGKEGSPWTLGGTVPSGKTLKGEWSVSGDATEAHAAFDSSTSFALPLPSAPTMHFIGVEEGEGESKEAEAVKNGLCKGTAASPDAEGGNLCVFATNETNDLREFSGFKLPWICAWETSTCTTAGEAEGTPLGFGVHAVAEAEGPLSVRGTWAVTAG